MVDKWSHKIMGLTESLIKAMDYKKEKRQTYGEVENQQSGFFSHKIRITQTFIFIVGCFSKRSLIVHMHFESFEILSPPPSLCFHS